MKKVVRLTESDLVRLTNKVIKEQTNTLPTPIKQITKSLGLDDVINMGGVNYSVKKLPTGKFKIFVTTPKYKTPVDASSAFGQGTMWKEYATQQEAQNVINSIVDKKSKSGLGIDPLSPIKKVGKSLGLTGIEEQVSNKKVVRLTESDLVRLVRRVIKEQPIEDDMIPTFGSTNSPMVILEGKSSKYVQKALRNLSPNVITIALKFCEGADFSEIDICEFPKLLYVLLKDTPNNFEEYVNCEYEKAGDDKYFFDN